MRIIVQLSKDTEKFEETGSVMNRKKSGRQRRRRYTENIAAVVHSQSI